MLDQEFDAARILANPVQELERGLAVATPEALAEGLRRARVGHRVEAELGGLGHETLAHGALRLAVPAPRRLGDHYAETGHGGDDLLAHVEAIRQLAAEDRDVAPGAIDLDFVLARKLHPVRRARLPGHGQGTHADALGDHVLRADGVAQRQQAVDVV